MKQILRMTGLIRPLLLMLALLLFGNARGWAETVTETVTLSEENLTSSAVLTNVTIAKNAFSITFPKNNGNTATTYYTTSPAGARLYPANSGTNGSGFKITANANVKITRVVYTLNIKANKDKAAAWLAVGDDDSSTNGSLSASTSAQTKNNQALTWTGKATSVELTNTGESGTQVAVSIAAITYESSSNLQSNDLALTGAPVALSFDLYNNSDAQVISYTTSSTGAVTVSGGEDYVTTSIDVDNKTITVTPTTVTPDAQTITIHQAADETYAAGSATFTVNISDTTPFDGGDITFVAGTDVGQTTSNNSADEVIKSVVTMSCTDAALRQLNTGLTKTPN